MFKFIKSNLIFTLLCICSVSYAQKKSNPTIHIPTATPYRFYESYQAFLDNKPINGYELGRKRINSKFVQVFDYDKPYTIINGEGKNLKPKEFPSMYFTNEQGLLIRHFDGDAYLVLVKDSFCLYLWPYKHSVRSLGNDDFAIVGSADEFGRTPSSFPATFWSEGFDNKILEIGSEFEKVLDSHKLLNSYERKQVKRKPIMSAMEYGRAKFYLVLEFINLLNKKN